MTATPTRNFLRDTIRAGRRDDCDRCVFPYTCSTHAADAVLNACRAEELFILERPAADQTIVQAKAEALRDFADHLSGMSQRGSNERITGALLAVADIARRRAVEVADGTVAAVNAEFEKLAGGAS